MYKITMPYLYSVKSYEPVNKVISAMPEQSSDVVDVARRFHSLQRQKLFMISQNTGRLPAHTGDVGVPIYQKRSCTNLDHTLG